MILLDTHVVLWLALEPLRISKKAKAAIERARAGNQVLAISDISLLEIATLEKKRRMQLDVSLDTFLSEAESRLIVLPMTGTICARAISLPSLIPMNRPIA